MQSTGGGLLGGLARPPETPAVTQGSVESFSTPLFQNGVPPSCIQLCRCSSAASGQQAGDGSCRSRPRPPSARGRACSDMNMNMNMNMNEPTCRDHARLFAHCARCGASAVEGSPPLGHAYRMKLGGPFIPPRCVSCAQSCGVNVCCVPLLCSVGVEILCEVRG